MHRKPIAASEPWSGRARGLGVCDVLALELAPVQVPWLIDELDELRGPLEEDLQRTRATGPNDELEPKEYRLHLLRLMRGSLPGEAIQDPVNFVGPSGMVEQVVRGAMRNVAGALCEEASRPRPDATAVQETAAAAAAWAETYADCRAVIGFNFDPAADPMAPL